MEGKKKTNKPKTTQNSQKWTGQPGKHRQRTVTRTEKENVAFLIKHTVRQSILSHDEIPIVFVSCEEL